MTFDGRLLDVFSCELVIMTDRRASNPQMGYFKNWGKLFGGTVPPNNTLFGGSPESEK